MALTGMTIRFISECSLNGQALIKETMVEMGSTLLVSLKADGGFEILQLSADDPKIAELSTELLHREYLMAE